MARSLRGCGPPLPVGAVPTRPAAGTTAGTTAAGRTSATLLPNLRYWVATLRVSDLVVADSRKSAVRLASEMEAARRR